MYEETVDLRVLKRGLDEIGEKQRIERIHYEEIYKKLVQTPEIYDILRKVGKLYNEIKVSEYEIKELDFRGGRAARGSVQAIFKIPLAANEEWVIQINCADGNCKMLEVPEIPIEKVIDKWVKKVFNKLWSELPCKETRGLYKSTANLVRDPVSYHIIKTKVQKQIEEIVKTEDFKNKAIEATKSIARKDMVQAFNRWSKYGPELIHEAIKDFEIGKVLSD